jgi:hypothetical protein
MVVSDGLYRTLTQIESLQRTGDLSPTEVAALRRQIGDTVKRGMALEPHQARDLSKAATLAFGGTCTASLKARGSTSCQGLEWGQQSAQEGGSARQSVRVASWNGWRSKRSSENSGRTGRSMAPQGQ